MRARRLTVYAQTGGCICRLTVCSQAVCAGRRLYMQACGGRKQQNHRPSPAESAAEVAGLSARTNEGAVCRRTYTQIPKAGEASRRRRATVRRRAYTQMPPSVHDCGRRSTVRAYSVRNQALSASPLNALACGGAKGGVVCAELCTQMNVILGQANRCAGRRRAKIDAIGHQRR